MSNQNSILSPTINSAALNAMPRFIIAGGGTGGHIFPAIAIANAIKKYLPQAEILFVGAEGKMEMEKVPAAGYKIKGITIAGFNRSSLLKNIWLPLKLLKSFIQVKSIFKTFTPDAVIGVGGYSSFPVLKYAQHKGIKTFLHESNSFAGKSNKMLAKNATAVFTATAGMEKFFPLEKITITGNPIRQLLQNNKVSKAEALQFFNLEENKKTVLSVGGSLGAQSINEALSKNLNAFAENNLQLIWQTGTGFVQQAKELAAPHKNIYVADFISKMEYAYPAADVVISRSGAMALSELAVMHKPSIFVPYPFAAEDHQTANAKNLVDAKAALMVKNSEVNEKLIPTLLNLMEDENLQQTLTTNISLQAKENADEKIVKVIFKKIGIEI